MNTYDTDSKRSYILELPEDEKFLSFVGFRCYEDICFYPGHMRLECCANILFATTKRDRKKNECHVAQNNLNLIVVDSFYEDLQCCLFKSSTYFDNEILQ